MVGEKYGERSKRMRKKGKSRRKKRKMKEGEDRG